MKRIWTNHGNLVQVFGKGILILASPGGGKTNLTLQLLDRGHYFISDDLVEFEMRETQLFGKRPILEPLLHSRSRGFLNISLLYPHQHLKETPIDYVIELQSPIPKLRSLRYIDEKTYGQG